MPRWACWSYFEFWLYAGELERWKPNPEMFTIALQQLDLPAQAVAYVGDNYYADVIGARALACGQFCWTQITCSQKLAAR